MDLNGDVVVSDKDCEVHVFDFKVSDFYVSLTRLTALFGQDARMEFIW